VAGDSAPPSSDAPSPRRRPVAREIHDGLAQYLFAVSTHAQMLESGTPVAEVGPQLKEAAALAQQEARFAILALSSASGTAPFDSALRRYVEFLTADGELAVDLEIDPAIRLAPDEQIEIFRIVQEGLGNIRRHAQRAPRRGRDRPASVGRRFVAIEDDGAGFPLERARADRGCGTCATGPPRSTAASASAARPAAGRHSRSCSAPDLRVPH
jgi:signal transduction histidine kinase